MKIEKKWCLSITFSCDYLTFTAEYECKSLQECISTISNYDDILEIYICCIEV